MNHAGRSSIDDSGVLRPDTSVPAAAHALAVEIAQGDWASEAVREASDEMITAGSSG
jgi:hypothetical protein